MHASDVFGPGWSAPSLVNDGSGWLQGLARQAKNVKSHRESIFDFRPRMVAWIEKTHGTKVRFGIVVLLAGNVQDTVDHTAGPIERARRPGPGHSTQDILTFSVKGADGRVLVRDVSYRARPFVGNAIVSSSHRSDHFAHRKLGQKTRGLIVAGLPFRNSSGIGSKNHVIIVPGKKSAAVADAYGGFHGRGCTF